MKIFRIILILLAVILLASCDTGYSGDIDPNKEVFNYEYPLQKGNIWEYLVKDQKINFSNDTVAVILGTDSLSYYQQKEICSDTVTVSGELTYKIETWETTRTHSTATIDTSTYTAKGTRFCNNSQNTLWQYGTNTEPFATPRPLLKYNLYIGDSWNYLVGDSYKAIKTINSFSDIGNERVCLIKSTLTNAQSGIIYDKTDGYYSRNGLIKEINLTEDVGLTSPQYPLGYGSADLIITKEVIRTNVK